MCAHLVCVLEGTPQKAEKTGYPSPSRTVLHHTQTKKNCSAACISALQASPGRASIAPANGAHYFEHGADNPPGKQENGGHRHERQFSVGQAEADAFSEFARNLHGRRTRCPPG